MNRENNTRKEVNKNK